MVYPPINHLLTIYFPFPGRSWSNLTSIKMQCESHWGQVHSLFSDYRVKWHSVNATTVFDIPKWDLTYWKTIEWYENFANSQLCLAIWYALFCKCMLLLFNITGDKPWPNFLSIKVNSHKGESNKFENWHNQSNYIHSRNDEEQHPFGSLFHGEFTCVNFILFLGDYGSGWRSGGKEKCSWYKFTN